MGMASYNGLLLGDVKTCPLVSWGGTLLELVANKLSSVALRLHCQMFVCVSWIFFLFEHSESNGQLRLFGAKVDLAAREQRVMNETKRR